MELLWRVELENGATVTGSTLMQPGENRIVCELGLGMNPNVTDLCGYTLLDEKMAGTFHIAVGANTMFGGENRATDHGDFVGRGEVEVLARDTTGYWRVKPKKNPCPVRSPGRGSL